MLLKIAEDLYARALRKDIGLPSLVCRPCEHRLENTIDFRNVISKIQQEFEDSQTIEDRMKRWVDEELSTAIGDLRVQVSCFLYFIFDH